jgi:hypothetical protein
MDHRELLLKYIRHVKDCEGVDFITKGGDLSEIDFTPEEWAELEALALVAREGAE